MISKGNTHSNGAKLAAYMVTGKEGERAELWGFRGFAADNITDAFRDVQIMSEATRCDHPFFHVQVRNREGEVLDRQQWEHTADRIGRMLGLGDQPRAIASHIDLKTGEEHIHIAWSRIDEDTMKAIPLPFFKDRLKKISRELELHFGLEPVTNKREGEIKFAPTRAEEEQSRRLGFNIHEIRNTIRACYDRSDCGLSFSAALEHEGLTLAKGEKRDFVVLDPAGGLHVLGKRTLDVSAAKIRDRLSDVVRDNLPTVEQARINLLERELGQVKDQQRQLDPLHWDRDKADQSWQDSVLKAAIDKEKTERNFVEPGDRKKEIEGQGAGTYRTFATAAVETVQDIRVDQLRDAAAQVWAAWCPEDMEKVKAANRSKKPISFEVPAKEEFARTLDEKGITFAVVTADEAARSQRQAAFARQIGRTAPRFKEGEIVLVTEVRAEHRRNEEISVPNRVQKIDQSLAEKFVQHLGNRHNLQGIDATLKLSNTRAKERAVEKADLRMENATKGRGFPREIGKLKGPGTVALKTGVAVGGGLMAVTDGLASLFAPTLTPEQQRDAQIARNQRQADAEHTIDYSQFTSEHAHQHRQQENEEEAARQKDRGGRDR